MTERERERDRQNEMREKADFVGQPLGLQGPRLLAQKNIHKELQHISAETETERQRRRGR